ncbi:MAG: hypothetical protein ACOC1K_00555 [Nanoarchaeota archaeon]
MIQGLLLFVLLILVIILLLSIIQKPFDERYINPCRFKILTPKYSIDGNKKIANFDIIVEKTHRYFINFPLLFKFYSDKKFKTKVKISYTVPGDSEYQELLNKEIEFEYKNREYVVYITEVVVGKINIEIELEPKFGNPMIEFEIMENSTCKLLKQHKLELKFP